jgi:hypothetical protein
MTDQSKNMGKGKGEKIGTTCLFRTYYVAEMHNIAHKGIGLRRISVDYAPGC